MSHQFYLRRINPAQPYSYKVFCLVVLLFVCTSTALFAQQNLSNGVALSGYDAVTYFTLGKAVKGESKFAANANGGIYYFSTQQNLEAFKKQPQKYMPQYGGWCAYAMGAKGEKVEVNPETFKILDGKLYLFYNKHFTNTLTSWNKDENNLKVKADLNWKKLTM